MGSCKDETAFTSDVEVWHVLEGPLRFRFPDREVDAPTGIMVFVPAGSPQPTG